MCRKSRRGRAGIRHFLGVASIFRAAGRVSSDLSDIIKRRPIELAALLRTTKGLKAEDIARLACEVQKAKGK
ncbi:MAG: hypothetical protein WA624_03100 [Methylocella sp.]